MELLISQKEEDDKSQYITKESFLGSKPENIDLVDELKKSECKIKYKINEQDYAYGTGFFMKYNSLKCLILTYHIINSNLVNKSIEIEIYNKEKINLVLNNRMIKHFKNLGISIIEIKESDRINNTDIEYLIHDIKYKEGGFKQYKYMEIICLQYPGGGNLNAQCGKIIDIINEYDFVHDYQLKNDHQGHQLYY